MPFDSQGNFTRVMNWTSDYENGIEIVCDRHDDEDDNFAAGLNDCFCRDGRATATGNFKMGSNKITGLGNGSSANDAINKSQLDGAYNELNTKIEAIVVEKFSVGDLKQSLLTANHEDWVLCDGQAISRTDYADLFDLIGTTYGSGDGVTTFNVPDYSNILYPTSTAVGVKGNGKAIGLTDGTDNAGLGTYNGTYYLTGNKGLYGEDVGTTITTPLNGLASSKAVSMTTDATKSGIEGSISSYVQINWYIKAK